MIANHTVSNVHVANIAKIYIPYLYIPCKIPPLSTGAIFRDQAAYLGDRLGGKGSEAKSLRIIE